jgi:hypothetical protein
MKPEKIEHLPILGVAVGRRGRYRRMQSALSGLQ